MKTLKNDWLIWLVIILPCFFIIAWWDKLPAQIPVHFNLNGDPDGYGSKAVALVMLPGINALLYLLFLILPMLDPLQKNYHLFHAKLRIIQTTIHLFLASTCIAIIFYSLGYPIDFALLMPYSICALFLVLGNYMGNIRPNHFIGIRTPWTLENEHVWIKTHRLAAKIWVAGSLLMMAVLPFLPKEAMGIAVIFYTAIISIIPIVYSFLVFKKEEVR